MQSIDHTMQSLFLVQPVAEVKDDSSMCGCVSVVCVLCVSIRKRKKENASALCPEPCACLGCPGNSRADKATKSLKAAKPRE